MASPFDGFSQQGSLDWVALSHLRFVLSTTEPYRNLDPGNKVFMLDQHEISISRGILPNSDSSLDWRLSRHTLLKDVFGSSTRKALCDHQDLFSKALAHLVIEESFVQTGRDRPLMWTKLIYHSSEVLQQLMACLPELQPFEDRTTMEINVFETGDRSLRMRMWISPEKYISESMFQTMQKLREPGIPSDMYLTVSTILLVASALCRTVLDDSLAVSRVGVIRLCSAISETLESPVQHRMATPIDIIHSSMWPTLAVCHCLFSGTSAKDDLFPTREDENFSASAGNGIYCYRNYLANPFQSYSSAVSVHVGRGTIEMRGRTYDHVYDDLLGTDVSWSRLPARPRAKSTGAGIHQTSILG